MHKEIINDKLYYSCLTFFITISVVINYNSNLMSGILPYYSDFSDFFLNNFEYSKPFTSGIYTWPMWGYGLVLLLGSKLKIIIIQQLVTLFTIVYVRSYLRNNLDSFIFHVMSLFILFAFPWFLFHVSLWPYSLSANFFTIGILLFVIGYEIKSMSKFIISAILFGVVLNMRSDYYYLVWILFFFSIIYSLFKSNFSKVKFLFVWILTIYLTLLPWFIYTKKYAGVGSFVSSNSGHVLFISLGQLPSNKWKITASDGDSVMYSLIQKKIGDSESSLSHKSSVLLTNEFKTRVLNDPKEYLNKCLHNLFSFMLLPFYIGDIQKAINDLKQLKEIKYNFKNNKIVKVFKSLYEVFNLKILFVIFLYLIGIITFYIFICSIFFFIQNSFRINNVHFFEYVIFLVFTYQLSLNILAYNLPIYTTNIYLLIIIFSSLTLNRKKGFKLKSL